MQLFFALIQIHAICLIVCAFTLRWNLPKSVLRVKERNSRRIDGSVSRRRNRMEFISIHHAFSRIYAGLMFLFIVTTLAGLLTAGMELRLPRFGVDAEPTRISATPNPPRDSSPEKSQWPVIAVYLVSTLMIAPQFIFTLYRRAISRYLSHAQARFKGYCLAEWQEMKETESEEELDLPLGSQQQPTI